MQQAGHREVDAVDRAPVHFGGNVEPRPGRPPDGIRVRVLQGGVGRNGVRRRLGGQLSECGGSSGCFVGHARAASLALLRAHAESSGRGGHQHLPRGCASDGHAVASGAAHRRRASGGLCAVPTGEAIRAVVECAHDRRRNDITGKCASHVRIGVGVERRRLLDPNQVPVGFHLLCRHHGQSRLRPLPHLAVGHQDGDDVVRRDQDPGVELAGAGGVVGDDAVTGWRKHHASDAHREAAANKSAGPDEGTTRPFTHGVLRVPLRVPRRPREWLVARARTCRTGRCW